mmetsp:Transcript_29361/g.71564  ORF Transcript_29361/g.71564 Transcript_29361/m.71564 type:complete len:281 (-) Transcript_29361:593-1435(-)
MSRLNWWYIASSCCEYFGIAFSASRCMYLDPLCFLRGNRKNFRLGEGPMGRCWDIPTRGSLCRHEGGHGALRPHSHSQKPFRSSEAASSSSSAGFPLAASPPPLSLERNFSSLLGSEFLLASALFPSPVLWRKMPEKMPRPCAALPPLLPSLGPGSPFGAAGTSDEDGCCAAMCLCFGLVGARRTEAEDRTASASNAREQRLNTRAPRAPRAREGNRGAGVGDDDDDDDDEDDDDNDDRDVFIGGSDVDEQHRSHHGGDGTRGGCGGSNAVAAVAAVASA